MKMILISVAGLVFINTMFINKLSAQKNPQLSTTELMFLVDVTDSLIFKQIHADFSQNLSKFFQNTGLGKIAAEEKFSLSVAPINSSGELKLSTASISIPRKGLSYNEEKKLSNPRPLLNMLNAKLIEFATISKNNQSQSSIIEIVLKAITQTTADESFIVICTDLIEHSTIHSMYKSIPQASDVSKILAKVDPLLLSNAKNKVKGGGDLTVIIVLKKLPGSHDYNKLRGFWMAFFAEVGISNVKFIDNLSQNPQI